MTCVATETTASVSKKRCQKCNVKLGKSMSCSKEGQDKQRLSKAAITYERNLLYKVVSP